MFNRMTQRLKNPLTAGRRRREAARGMRSDVPLPFDMFDEVRTAREQRTAHKLERIYHVGQDKSWDGKELLAELIDKHGGIELPADKAHALAQIFAVILWGELAAWKVSAQLALDLEPLEAKMAATSQAHDEARHFYTMYDYLSELGDVPTELGPRTQRVLLGTLRARTLAQRLTGMQLMVEPMALTLFQTMRKSELEPVLSELLMYYERDEARHVALGVLHLPKLLKDMTLTEAGTFWGWQFKEYWAQILMLKELEPHFEALGISTYDVAKTGRDKQIRAITALVDELGYDLKVQEAFLRFFDARIEYVFPHPSVRHSKRARLRRALGAAVELAPTPENALAI